ncbi:MAG: epoxyqueuosine reductase [Clostridia bacterium]|nr:epoxyqueuosine reductase [Clostridia bacterium]
MIYEEIKQTFLSLGITETGIIPARDGNKAISTDISDFKWKSPVSSVDDILPGAESIIVFLVPYNSGVNPENLSVYATGRDYHNVCREISEKISAKLTDAGYHSVSFADVGPLSERTLARLAGLGIIGSNKFLINNKYGTYTFIGYIITDCILPVTAETAGECIQCGKCIESCPGGALTSDGFCSDKCVSYITQKKGELTENEIALLKESKSVWGCDICQKVCPMNNGKELTGLKDFRENLILCIKNEYLSNNQFKKKYADRAFSWRGKSVIDRNLSILNDKKE